MGEVIKIGREIDRKLRNFRCVQVDGSYIGRAMDEG